MAKLLIFLLSFVSITVYAQTQTPNLVGEWQVLDNSDTLIFTFEKDSILTMYNTSKKERIGGRETIRKGKSVRMIYLIDLSRSPFGIDMVMQENGSKTELSRMHGIFKVITGNTIQIDLGGSQIHNGIFGEHSFIMERKKE